MVLNICPCNRLTFVGAKCPDTMWITHNNKEYSSIEKAFGIGSGEDLFFSYCMDCGKIQSDFPRPIVKGHGTCPDCGCEERTDLENDMTYSSFCNECGLMFP